jgi:hypothetical protein
VSEAKQVVNGRPNEVVWKWISGILAAVIMTGAASYIGFGVGVNARVSSLEAKEGTLEKLVEINTRSLSKLTEISNQLREENASTKARLEALERGN